MSILQNYFLVWLIAFGAGAAAGVGFYFAVLQGKADREPAERTPLSETDKRLHDQVISVIDRRLTEKALGLREVAAELNVNPQTIARLFKRHTGRSFKDCLIRSRLEVAKERLRSSNCPENTVAETCGFKSATEFNRLFWRFFRTTPAKYRMEQQVT